MLYSQGLNPASRPSIRGAGVWITGAVLALVISFSVHAASCCGGGAASSLVLPKFSQSMVDVAVDAEHYDGFWRGDGTWSPDPPGADLNQYRLNLGAAHRLGDNWQAALSVPYVWNRNEYAGLERNTEGLGDMALTLWYEAFDNVMCVWRVESWVDLKPAVYWGVSLTVPTGTSPYDDVRDNFDITGRGFYRLDGLLVLEKTVYPWTATLSLSYGTHPERPVNREFGEYVAPYDKQLGDRASATLGVGYTVFTQAADTWTATASYSDLWEDEARIDGERDPTSGLRKRAAALALAWADAARIWVVRAAWSHALQRDGWGRNFPTTDIFTVGVSHVFP